MKHGFTKMLEEAIQRRKAQFEKRCAEAVQSRDWELAKACAERARVAGNALVHVEV